MRESATKNPETQNQLDELIKISKENQCDVPEEKTTCQTYQDDAEKALSEKNYDAYISASMKLLSADCGREVNSCERTLAEASLVKRTLTQVAGNADLEEKYKNRLEELKAEYYANPECRDDNRCSEIDGTQPTGEVVGAAPTRIANTDSILKLATADATPTTAGAAPTTASPANLETASALRVNNIATFEKVGVLKLTPGSIFEDDKEYYEKNCKKVDLTCDDLLKRYNLSSTTPSANIDLLDVSDEVRQQILRCMPTVPTERIVPQNPKISCEPSSRNVTTGKEVTWTATVEGASNRDNIITYSWSGDATGTGESVKSTYNTAGEKTVVVVATGAGEQAIRATCSTTVSPISPANPPTNPPAIDPASNPPTPSPSPTPTPSPSPAVAPAIAPPTPPSPVSSPTPSPSSASAPIVKVPTPTAPAVAPAKPSSPISSPTPAPSTPVSLPITTPSAPVVATTSTPKVVSPAAPSAPTIHSSAPVTVVTPATPVTPSKEIPPTITPTGPEVYIYLIGFVVGQLYFFRRKVFGLVRNK
jgi:plastocyanin